MISLIATCLLLVNAAASHAVSLEQTVKILSPAPWANIHAGASLNVTLQIEKDSINVSQQVLLGFGLNSEESQHPTSLGEIFLGLLNTTQTPFNAEGKLEWSLSIPAREKFNSTSTSFSLVVSQYMFSGPSHTPHCGLVAVPVKVAAQSPYPTGSGKGDGSSPNCATGINCPTRASPAMMTPKESSATSGQSPASAMNTTSSMPKSVTAAKANTTNIGVKASGHNTADNIPGTAIQGGAPTTPQSSASKTNVTSAVANKDPKTGNSPKTGKDPKAGNATASSKDDATNTQQADSSAALAISTSHVIATIAALAGIIAIV